MLKLWRFENFSFPSFNLIAYIYAYMLYMLYICLYAYMLYMLYMLYICLYARLLVLDMINDSSVAS